MKPSSPSLDVRSSCWTGHGPCMGPQSVSSRPVQGSIPYVPFLRAPYYVWVGHVPQLATILQENKVEAPPMFPPTFLYTQSWEDPRPDAKVSQCLAVSGRPMIKAPTICWLVVLLRWVTSVHASAWRQVCIACTLPCHVSWGLWRLAMPPSHAKVLTVLGSPVSPSCSACNRLFSRFVRAQVSQKR